MSDPSHTCHFLDRAAYRAADDARVALGRTRESDAGWKAANKSDHGWAGLSEVVRPCAMWHSWWYFDPADPGDAPTRDRALAAIAAGTFDARTQMLSRFYWQRWSDKRPPISVLCPNGREWCVDAVSSNGEGWEVEGDPPLITCTPSIDVPGYHGHLRNGVFTPGM